MPFAGAVQFSVRFGMRFICVWEHVIAAYGGNILAPVLALISLRKLKKALISLRFQGDPSPPRGGPLLKHPPLCARFLRE